MKYVLSITLALTICSCSSSPNRAPASSTLGGGDLQTHFLTLPYGSESIDVRVGVQNPDGAPVGDVLYIHGFADRLDNHAPLFEAWNRAGLRVIAFDLPSHGEDKGSYNNLNNFDFKALAELAAKVEQDTKPKTKCPLILAGWSTGGLIVVRLLQKNWTEGFSRPISGAILFSPGVSVRKTPWTFGNRLGEVTDATLTHDPHPPHVAGPIQPDTPFWSKLIFHFAPDLILNSVLSQTEKYPSDVRTLVFSGGDSEDMYAKSPVVREWVREQNFVAKEESAPSLINISCPHAMHEIDNELPEFGGVEVRNTAAEFARDIAETLPVFSSDAPTFGTVCSLIK